MLMAVVAAYSVGRLLLPSLNDAEQPRDPQHPRDILGWHAVAGAVMAVMLVVTIPGRFAGAALALFGLGVLWSVVQVARRISRAAHLRLGVCCVAMLAMLAPQVVALGATSSGAAAVQMDGMVMAAHSTADVAAGQPGSLLTMLAVVLVVAMVALVAGGVRRLAVSGDVVGYRLETVGETVMATAMAYMLVVML